jgi:hypothetical protein
VPVDAEVVRKTSGRYHHHVDILLFDSIQKFYKQSLSFYEITVVEIWENNIELTIWVAKAAHPDLY